ncbi:MAG TPA: hypothetical protein VFW47_07520 [Phenylobacterium sp.]|nr:hypothetical protein [Phenylobacterium sp.]
MVTRSALRLVPLLMRLAASPAAAQDPTSNTFLQMRETDLIAQQELARQRDIALRNDLNALDARLRTLENLRNLEANNLQIRLPEPVVPPRALSPSQVALDQFPSIPDAALAASRERVRAASRNRR